MRKRISQYLLKIIVLTLFASSAWADPDLTITKQASVPSASPGDSVTYTVTVSNIGPDDAIDVVMTDDLSNILTNASFDGNVTSSDGAFTCSYSAPTITCSSPQMSTTNPGEEILFTYTVVVNSTIVNPASLVNTANITSTVIPNTPSNTVTIPLLYSELSLQKTADLPTVSAAGQVITYNFLVTNTGTVVVNGLSINETSFSGSGSLSAINCPVTDLNPTDSTTCTATYTVSQADIDAGGSINNEAEATGNLGEVTSPRSSASVTVNQTPTLTLTKSALPASVSAVGDNIAYSFLVTNTGNTTLTNLAINEISFSGSGGSPVVSCPVNTLAPTASTTCTASYNTTQADIDSAAITNTATASATAPDTSTVTSAQSSASVTTNQTSTLTLTKSALPASVSAVGDNIAYSFLVTNTGNTTLTNLTINEISFSGTGGSPVVSCPVNTLAPAASTTCTASYNTTQADIDSTAITNTATASATAPDTSTVTSGQSSASVTTNQTSSLTLTKSALPASVSAAGDNIAYSFLVTNTGNTTLTNLAINEISFSGSGGSPVVSCPVNTLAPAASTTCTASYNTTQPDIDSTAITNTATATATAPDTSPVTSAQSSASVTTSHTSTLTLSKTALPASVSAAGQNIAYSFVVTNTGNTTLSNIAINEVSFSGTGGSPLVTCPVNILAPSASTTCTASYSTTQNDIDAGVIDNTAEAVATAPGNIPVTSPQSSASVQVSAQGGALTIVKSANVKSFSVPGTVIAYNYLITNTGVTNLTNLAVVDSKLSAVSCPATTLAAGANMSCSGNYVTTIQDARQGSVTNVATVTALAPDGSTLTAQTTLTIAFDPEMIRNKTLSAVRNFLNARTQMLLTAAPDRYRIIRKLSPEKKACNSPGSFGSIRPTANGANLNGSISASQFSIDPQRLDVWAEAHAGYFDQNNVTYSRHGNFSVLYLGVDYLFTPAIVGGLLAENDILNQNGSIRINNAHGSGWLLGPYISTRFNSNLYLHTRAGWGGSSNKINPLGYYDDSFTTTRSLYNAELVGDFQLKKWLIMPTAGVTYFSENQRGFMNSLNIFIPEQTVSLGQLNFGPEFAYQFTMNTQRCKEIGLRFTIQGLYNFDQNNGSSLDDGLFIPYAQFSGRAKLAVDFILPSGFSVTPMVSYDGIGSNAFNAIQAQIQISAPLG